MSAEKKAAWYVLYTKSRFEKVVYDGLVKKKKEAFLPTIRTRSRRRDRRIYLQRPLFPGYLFVKTTDTPADRLDVLKTVGVVNLISNRNMPIPVPEQVIDSLKIIVDANDEVTRGSCLQSGEPVRVVYGPFAGVIGIFVRHQSADKVVVNIEAMGQAANIYVAAEDVAPLSDKKIEKLMIS